MLSPLQLAKKWAAHRPQKLASASPAGAPLLFLHDKFSGNKFLVDTGAALSVFPHRSSSPPSGPPLVAADGRSIPSWGRKQFRLSFSNLCFSHDFVLAGVSTPIIGLDFLQDNALLVDTAGSRILTSAGGELSAVSGSDVFLPVVPSQSIHFTHGSKKTIDVISRSF